jgi:hypothetical protein
MVPPPPPPPVAYQEVISPVTQPQPPNGPTIANHEAVTLAQVPGTPPLQNDESNISLEITAYEGSVMQSQMDVENPNPTFEESTNSYMEHTIKSEREVSSDSSSDDEISGMVVQPFVEPPQTIEFS